MQIDEGLAPVSAPTPGGVPAPRIRRPGDDAGYGGADDHRAWLADPDNCAALADRLADTARRDNVTALSWDVFDTALLREPKSEARRFLEMGRAFAARLAAAGGPDVTAEDALLARAEAARAAYHMAPLLHGNREGTLSGIAGIACMLLGCPDAADLYVDSELAVEAASLAPNPLVTALAGRLPDLPILFLSDMYIEGPRIARLVADKFPGLEIAATLSSADGLGSKRGGGVFANAAGLLGVEPGRILHLGDSLAGDFRAPRRAGWRSVYLPLPGAERAARQTCYTALAADLAARGVTLNRHLAFSI